MGLAGRLQRHAQGDLLRAIAKAVLRLMIVSDAGGLIGAGRRERAKLRMAWRKGWRDRALATWPGTGDLKGRSGGRAVISLGILETRKTPEQALGAVIQDLWKGGASPRSVDGLVQAMRSSGISKSTVFTRCKEVDERIGAFPNRPSCSERPPVWPDATCRKQGGSSVWLRQLPVPPTRRGGMSLSG